MRTIIVVVVAVVVVILLGAVLLGAFTAGSSGGSSGAAPFSSARTVADAFAAGHGTWDLIEAVGVAAANASYLPYNGTTGNPNCTTTALVGSIPSNLSFPAFRGSLTSGDAPVWLFAYLAPTTASELAIFEVSGQVVLAIEGSSGCLGASFSSTGGLSSTIADSSTAVSAAAEAGGLDFLQSHPGGVTLTMLLLGGFSFANQTVAPTWEIEWSTCASAILGRASGPSSGYEFSALVNATTGVVVPMSPTNTTCGTAPPTQGISSALTLGPPSLFVGPGTGETIASQGCTSGDYCYSVPIETAQLNVTPADFEMTVTNGSSGETFLGTVGFAILNAGGGVVVSSTGPAEDQWTPGLGNSNTLLTAGMAFTIDMGTMNPATGNWFLSITGEGPFAGSAMGMGL